MKERNIGGALLRMLLPAFILLMGSFCCKLGNYRRLKADCLRLRTQNEYLKEWGSELDKRQKQFRTMRHEMVNEYILEMGYLEKGLYRQLEEHYREKTGYFNTQMNQRLIDTGNVGMDAILSGKLKEADEQSIKTDVEYQIDGKIKMADSDLNTLIGNLMNNAMEAVRQLESGKRKIMLRIRADAASFFLEISNPYIGSTKKKGKDVYISQKGDRQLHGLGLLQVKRAVNKYGGKVVISDKNHLFNVKVLLYL